MSASKAEGKTNASTSKKPSQGKTQGKAHSKAKTSAKTTPTKPAEARPFIRVGKNPVERMSYAAGIAINSNIVNRDFTTRFRSKAAYVRQMMRILPNPDIVLKNSGKLIEAYRDLTFDPHVSSCIQSRKSGTLSSEWRINQGNSTDTVYKAVLMQMAELDIDQILGEWLDTPLMGYNVAEIDWQVKRGYIMAENIQSRPQEWFKWNSDAKPVFVSSDHPQGELFPDRKMIVTQYNPTYMNPYGQAVLARCFWSVTFKKEIMTFAIQYAEKFGGTFIVGKYDPLTANDEVKDNMKNDLFDLIADGVGIVPQGTDVLLQEAAKTSSMDLFNRLIVFFNAEISKAILSQTLTTEQGDTGSYAMSQTHLEVRRDVVDSDMKIVTKAMNRFIRWFCDLNFGFIGAYPTFEFFEEQDTMTAFADRDVKLYSQGVRFTQQYYRERYGFVEGDIYIVDQYGNRITSDGSQQTQPAQAPPQPAQTPATQPTGFHAIRKPSANLKSQYAGAIALATQVPEMGQAAPDVANDIMHQMLKPVIEMIQSGSSFEDVNAKLSEVFPDVDTDSLEEYLATSMFYADVVGRLSTPVS